MAIKKILSPYKSDGLLRTAIESALREFQDNFYCTIMLTYPIQPVTIAREPGIYDLPRLTRALQDDNYCSPTTRQPVAPDKIKKFSVSALLNSIINQFPTHKELVFELAEKTIKPLLKASVHALHEEYRKESDSFTAIGLAHYNDFCPSKSWLDIALTLNGLTLDQYKSFHDPTFIINHKSPVKSAIISSDGKWLVTLSKKCTIKLVNLRTSEEYPFKHSYNRAIFSVQFSPDGEWLIIKYKRNIVQLFHMQSQMNRRIPHTDPIFPAKFSPDSKFVLTYSHDKTVQLLNLKTGVYHSFGHSFLRDPCDILSTDFSPDGKWCSIEYSNNILELIFIESSQSFKLFHQTQSNSNPLSSCKKGLLATHSSNHTVRVWNITSDIPKNPKVFSTSSDNPINKVCTSSDGNWLCITTQNPEAILLNLETMESSSLVRKPVTHSNFSDDGIWLALSHSDFDITLVNLQTKNTRSVSFDQKISFSQFSPDSTWLATLTIDRKSIQILNLETGKRFCIGNNNVICRFHFSEEGGWFYSTFWNREINFLNLETGDTVTVCHDNLVLFEYLSRNERWALTTTVDGTIKLANLATTKEFTIPFFNTLSHFSNDQKWLIATSGKSVKLFSIDWLNTECMDLS